MGLDSITLLGAPSGSYTMAANIEILVLADSASTVGLSIFENALDNTIVGNAGPNTFNGGAGSDIYIGGLGDDIYVFFGSGDHVFESPVQGTTLYSLGMLAGVFNTPANVERVNLGGGGSATTINGNDAANQLMSSPAGTILRGVDTGSKLADIYSAKPE